jgi:uncharacterized NAD(P)/FAD-binding protein YdhS
MVEQSVNPTVIIIGGGFSGIMVVANLIRQAQNPIRIFLIEKTGHFAKGVAYSTSEAYHLLNVPGGNMGAFAHNPQHFMEWLIENEAFWRATDPAFTALPIDPAYYYPRKLYGVYLEKLFEETLVEAARKGISVTTIADEAVDVDITDHRTAAVRLKKQSLPEARHVVIATGNTPVQTFPNAHGIFLCKEKYIENMWSRTSAHLLQRKDLSHLPESTQIAIVGTGLTMVDAFLSLRQKGYKGKIIAISRHGKLPQPHRTFQKYKNFLDAKEYPTSVYALLTLLRNEVKKAKEAGYDWRAVLQEFRPATNTIWAALALEERRYIAKRLMSYWNIHRHRIPESVLSLLETDKAAGALTIIPGTIYYIGGRNNGPLMVSYRKRGEDVIASLAADYVINCSGPETDIAKSRNPFLLKLRDKGIISVGTLRMGIELTSNGRVRGKAPDIFHAVGALLVGEQLESTAVPDIRQHAEDTAKRIVLGSEPEDYSRYYNYFI